MKRSPSEWIRSRIILLRTYRIKMILARNLRIYRILTGTSDRVYFPPSLFSYTGTGQERKIGMIDFSYHRKTVSSAFFTDLLRSIGSVMVFWDSRWIGGAAPSTFVLRKEQFELLIVWQSFYYHSIKYLEASGCRAIFIVPMYDDAHNLPDSLFLRYRKFNWISFSSSFHDRFLRMNLQSFNVQYFPSVTDSCNEGHSRKKGLHGFFWQRTNDITWRQIRELIKGSEFNGFHLHLALDPLWYKEVIPSQEEMVQYNITISHWFETKEDYIAALEKANVFFAPRLYEGIGMPVLEAMGLGKLVVAPDLPVTNEYIVNGQNGILYDPRIIKPLDFTNTEKMAAQARQDAFRFSREWSEKRETLVAWICGT